MANDWENKKYGAYIDRTMKIIKLNYLQAFKAVGVDVTPEQWVLVDSLYQQNGVSQTDLANGIFKNAPTVSRIIDLLCKKGITERRRFANDRRRYKIFLTEKGKKVYEKALPKVLELREQGWQNLSEEDYETFLRIINQVFNNFEQENEAER